MFNLKMDLFSQSTFWFLKRVKFPNIEIVILLEMDALISKWFALLLHGIRTHANRTPWQALQPFLMRADMQHTLLRDCSYSIFPLSFHSADNLCTLSVIGITQLCSSSHRSFSESLQLPINRVQYERSSATCSAGHSPMHLMRVLMRALRHEPRDLCRAHKFAQFFFACANFYEEATGHHTVYNCGAQLAFQQTHSQSVVFLQIYCIFRSLSSQVRSLVSHLQPLTISSFLSLELVGARPAIYWVQFIVSTRGFMRR